MKISVCTDMLFREMPTQEAMRNLKEAGADAVEFWSINQKDLGAIAAAGRDLDLPVAVFCAPGEPIPIAPDAARHYPEALRRLGEACDLLSCRKLIMTSGVPDWNWTPAQMHERLIATVEACLPVLEACDMTLLLEPLNATELSYLRSSREAFDICRMVVSPRVQVLFDIYHMQYMEGNLINTIGANLTAIGHFHVADLPGRTAPGLGEINYPNIVAAAEKGGYGGYVGLEYVPAADRQGELKQVIAALKG